MRNLSRRLFGGKAGQSMSEYAVLLALIAIIALVAVKLLGSSVHTEFPDVATQVGH
jgi:Flp pilus assembly pilin Flp